MVNRDRYISIGEISAAVKSLIENTHISKMQLKFDERKF